MDGRSRMLGWNMNTDAFTTLLCCLSYTVIVRCMDRVIGDSGRLISEFFHCSPSTKQAMNVWRE